MKNIKKLALFSLLLVLSSNQPIETETSALKTVAGSLASSASALVLAAFISNYASSGYSYKDILKPSNAEDRFYRNDFILEQLTLSTLAMGFGKAAYYCSKTGGNTGAIIGTAIPVSLFGIPLGALFNLSRSNSKRYPVGWGRSKCFLRLAGLSSY